MRLYVIGSLRNPAVPQVAKRLREAGFLVFDDWYAAGPEADDKWQAYEQARGRTFAQALDGHAARHVFEFDRKNLEKADAVVLVLPAGKSAHLELGWALGQNKLGYVLLPGEPERYDVMYRFADGVYTSIEQLLEVLRPKKLVKDIVAVSF